MEFQSEVSQSHGYLVQEISTIDDIVTYNVNYSQSCSSSKPKILTHDTRRDQISCSCSKFEFDGIPCRHILAFWRINQVFQLPEKYILKRWTRDAKIDAIYIMDNQNINDNPLRSLMSRHSRLSYKALVLVDDASLTDEGAKYLEKQLDFMRSKIKEMNISPTFTEGTQRRKTLDKVHNINDPSDIRTKGSGKRLQSSKEKSVSKTRICHGCGRRGVSHDKRNCPNLQNGLNVDDHHNNDDNASDEDFIS
ncbi:hypothetical protein C2S52_020857 [Perilla frutescens var. hirtella]|nr:hypothetical protein C2S52_020857 [Perilla frutescens var. hirtella]